MSKFKVGDRVRHTTTIIAGTVVDDRLENKTNVKWDNGNTLWHLNSFLEHINPLVQETQPKRRSEILSTAEELINGQRAKDYGDAAENFQRIADLWAPILGVQPTPAQVALCLTQLKVARIITSPGHTDSWVDAAGYIALGAETALKDQP